MTWHVVCHDCEAESELENSEYLVRELVEMHRESYPDHRVTFEEVDRE